MILLGAQHIKQETGCTNVCLFVGARRENCIAQKAEDFLTEMESCIEILTLSRAKPIIIMVHMFCRKKTAVRCREK